MTEIIDNLITCNTCNVSLEKEGAIIRHAYMLSGRITALCVVCLKPFYNSENFIIVLSWGEEEDG